MNTKEWLQFAVVCLGMLALVPAVWLTVLAVWRDVRAAKWQASIQAADGRIADLEREVASCRAGLDRLEHDLAEYWNTRPDSGCRH